MFKEFKEFAMRGNVIDLAVGVIIGGAFGKIVSSFVSDVMMPLLGVLLGNINFTNYFLVLSGPQNAYPTLQAAQAAGAATLNYGVFLSNILDFLIVALALFFFIKAINKLRRQDEITKKCTYCFKDIPREATKCPYCTADLK